MTQTSGERFICFVPTPGEPRSDHYSIVAELSRLFAGKGFEVSAGAGGQRSPSMCTVGIDHLEIAIVAVDSPLPTDAYADAVARCPWWTTSAEDIGTCRGHIIIALAREVTASTDRLNGAAACTLVAAAAANLAEAPGLVWPSGSMVVQTEGLLKACHALTEEYVMPSSMWFNAGPAALPTGQQVLRTFGLAPFIGFDFCLDAAVIPQSAAVQLLLNIATYFARTCVTPGLGETVVFGEQSYRCLETVDAELRLLEPDAKG